MRSRAPFVKTKKRRGVVRITYPCGCVWEPAPGAYDWKDCPYHPDTVRITKGVVYTDGSRVTIPDWQAPPSEHDQLVHLVEVEIPALEARLSKAEQERDYAIKQHEGLDVMYAAADHRRREAERELERLRKAQKPKPPESES